MKLGIYCRISRLKDGNDLSIEDQKQKGIAKAKELNIPYEFYIDEGLSGASEKIEDRPEFERFLGDVSTGKITHVFAFDQSRFERNPQIRFVINDLFKKNKVVYFTQMDGIVDLYDPQAEFFGDLLSVINKFHVTTTKLKVKSALMVRAKQGKSKGILPYGYTKDSEGYIIIEEDEAMIVREIYALSNSGSGTPAIAEILNSRNIPTRFNTLGKGSFTIKNKWTGKPTTIEKSDVIWAPNTVLNIIKNPFYKGERQYKGEVLPVPAIISAEYWNEVNYHLQFNKNNTGKKVEYRYLLKGLLRCGICGRNMYGHKRENKHDNHYMCSSKRIKNENCGNRSINIDKIENFIWLNLFVNGELDRRIENEFKFDQSEVDRLKEQIDSLNTKMEGLGNERKKAIDLTIKGLISEDEIAGNLADIATKLKEVGLIKDDVQTKLNALKYSNEIVETYKSTFQKYTETSTFEQKKNIINYFINNIIVTYSKDTEDYLINIEYKIDIPSENVVAKLNKPVSKFFDVDEDGNNFPKYSVEPNGYPQPILFDKEFLEDFPDLDDSPVKYPDDENVEVEGENKDSFIKPLVDKIKKFHQEGITIPYPTILTSNAGKGVDCEGEDLHPSNQQSNRGYQGECKGDSYKLRMKVRIDKDWKKVEMD